jgi:transposase InsO family protein
VIHRENLSPATIHSNQDTEHSSDKYFQALSKLNIKIPMSAKASPWLNGRAVSF